VRGESLADDSNTLYAFQIKIVEIATSSDCHTEGRKQSR
jgi:hypothetical protein